MILRWEGETPLADADAVASLYHVSVRTVRRHCTPARRDKPAGPGSVQAWYDALAAADQLAGVAARPERTAAALRAQQTRER